MALSQSAVSGLLEGFRAGKGVDVIRESVPMVLQALIVAEAVWDDVRDPLARSFRGPAR